MLFEKFFDSCDRYLDGVAADQLLRFVQPLLTFVEAIFEFL